MEGLIIFAILLGVGYVVGSSLERQHLASLQVREQKTRQMLITNVGRRQPLPEAREAQMVVGSVVISSDYFKTFMGGIMNLLGGRISVYETLVERGRREAILRMKEAAIAQGASQIINVRMETSELSANNGNGLVSLEIIAYGTSLR
jgi:uncharacterized protein YbjQ (UPF0145 family)